jgi:uncharacterized protein YifN (PemK superfamily)
LAKLFVREKSNHGLESSADEWESIPRRKKDDTPSGACASSTDSLLVEGAMSINFVPERGRILICDFDRARVSPEMAKIRRVVVMSPRSYNERHGIGPGRCFVVPLSATDPGPFLTAADIPFAGDRYETLTVPVWAICSAAMSVSHARLDRVRAGHHFSVEVMSNQDLARVELGLRHALGFPPPPDS